MKETLLEIAKKIKKNQYTIKEYNDEHIELAIAWIKGEISNKQISKVLNFTSPNYSTQVMQFVNKALQIAYLKNKITFHE